MSTREEILSHLTYSLNQEMVFSHEAESAAEKLIDNLLHEEAEKIRKKWAEEEDIFQEDQFMDGYGSGLNDGADLIDPYKE
ncbi:hypothetical protein [Streptomyces globisporus]|uniref:hypothetical protein n=1 Tax=Streptomyces globisporus TaxID=1908 RepID=UPI0036CFB961